MADELAKTYDPTQVEGGIYKFWVQNGYFQAPIVAGQEPFTIMIPPPNVTGALHMGHALDNALQDIFVRWHRMRGEPTLWLPGTDHAGLATQIKVEEVIKKEEGRTRHDLGREQFVERVWQWKEKYGHTIIHQLQRLGASCDWSRERFTMDDTCSRAVREVFVRLHEQGLIYKGERMTNWCPVDQTALSDIEVVHEDHQGKLWYFRYPLEDESGYVQVATTRPETMLGDTAVAVNPDDDRYRAVVGRRLRHPATGRLIPIVADSYVDPAFGTGAVKVTPFHDPNDFDIAQRHGLEAIQVIGWQGEITAQGGQYAGLDRYACRKQLVSELEAGGFLVKITEHQHAVGHCQRCDSVVEPLISAQWFVRMAPLAEPGARAVRDGRVEIVPDRFKAVYLHWLDSIRDWCISRQIFWGHRIPVWYCQACGNETVTAHPEGPSQCRHCGSELLRQDPDCLDTWFSSALWPFSTLGWPEPTPDLKYFYPTSILVTGYDILFFWVARMIFSGLAFTDSVPFHTVLLHGLVRDSEGRKMSKSLGNGIDPLEVIDKYGADALRFMLISGVSPGNDVRFYWDKVESARNFANKLWNASRFSMMNLQDFDANAVPPLADALAAAGEAEDRWIVSRLQTVAGRVEELMTAYEPAQAVGMLYDFIWSEFCDWYLEMIKPRLHGRAGDAAGRRCAQQTLWYTLDGILHLLHPFMPFVTEAIWQKLPRGRGLSAVAGDLAGAGGGADAVGDLVDNRRAVAAVAAAHAGFAQARAQGAPAALVVDPWLRPNPALSFPEDEERVAVWMEVIRGIRNIRAEMAVPAGKPADVELHCESAAVETAMAAGIRHLKALAQAGEVLIRPAAAAKPEQAAATMAKGVAVFVPLKGLIDTGREIARLEKERERVAADLSRARGKLANPNFVSRAAPEAVEKERAKEAELGQKLRSLEGQLSLLRSAN